MSEIAGIETVLVQLPTRREHKWAGLTEPIGRYVLVRAVSEHGVVGWGEAPALKDWGGEFGRYFGESPPIVETVISNYLAPAVVGLDVGNIVAAHAQMDAVIKGYPYAKAAVEFALYDLAARSMRQPVHMLLGGRVRDRIPVTHSIGLLDIDEAVGLLQAVRGMNIVGGDIVCMMPTKDAPNQITALTATSIMFEMISMIAENVKRKTEANL